MRLKVFWRRASKDSSVGYAIIASTPSCASSSACGLSRSAAAARARPEQPHRMRSNVNTIAGPPTSLRSPAQLARQSGNDRGGRRQLPIATTSPRKEENRSVSGGASQQPNNQAGVQISDSLNENSRRHLLPTAACKRRTRVELATSSLGIQETIRNSLGLQYFELPHFPLSIVWQAFWTGFWTLRAIRSCPTPAVRRCSTSQWTSANSAARWLLSALPFAPTLFVASRESFPPFLSLDARLRW